MKSLFFNPSFARGIVCVLAFAGFNLACSLNAQVNRQGGDRNARLEELLDADEAAQRLQSMRGVRMEGDFRFEFVLEHLPRRDEATLHAGTLWGSSTASGTVNRIQMAPTMDNEASIVEFIVYNGEAASVWKRTHPTEPFYKLTGDALFEPIIPGVLYTPFDLQMPFLYWSDYSYVAPTRALNRLAQEYEMYPPSGSIYEQRGIKAVRIAIDDVYDALLSVEVLNEDGTVLTEFSVESLKKVDGTYIVNKIVLSDLKTKDRTRFVVEEAQVGLSLDPHRFFDVSAGSSN